MGQNRQFCVERIENVLSIQFTWETGKHSQKFACCVQDVFSTYTCLMPNRKIMLISVGYYTGLASWDQEMVTLG